MTLFQTVEEVTDTTPLITNDAIVMGILLILLAVVFLTSSQKTGAWAVFYKYVPALLMCYLLPSILSSLGVIAPEWTYVTEDGTAEKASSSLYYIASRFLLPAALILMTLSIDLKAVFGLGPKALAMFFAGTIGIVLGGPIAILLIGTIYPDAFLVPEATEIAMSTLPNGELLEPPCRDVWCGLSTLAGSWIGGGANQTAMLEIYKYDQTLYGGMVLVDIVVANLWMALLLLGIGSSGKINKWLKADDSAIERLKAKVSTYSQSVKREATVTDLMVMGTVVFIGVVLAHQVADLMSEYLNSSVSWVAEKKSFFSFLGNQFFWMISVATIFGIFLSFTPAKNYEGIGASKYGSVMIYILVATIGMKMDLGQILDNPALILIGLIWMAIHAGILILTAKLIKAPYFFLAVGSQANVGGAASAPIVAAEFHPSLTTVGVLLAVFGYVVGTVGAIICTVMMQAASGVVV